jgi:flagellar FliJ protein
MADKHVKKLGRLLRVRTLQLDMVHAQEAVARNKVADEEALHARIAQLAQGVAPRPAPTPGGATTLIAAAHYRERLHQSAFAAEKRVADAQRGLDNARAATREAKRDQTAIEKLIERAEANAARKAMRALEDMPATSRKRHDPC